MDKYSKLMNIVFVAVIIGAVFIGFMKYILFKNYTVVIQIDCNPLQEQCFRYACEETGEEGGCSGNPEEDIFYYKKLIRKAYALPECDARSADCDWKKCSEGETPCIVKNCSQETLTKDDKDLGIICADKEQYRRDFLEGKEMTNEEEEATMETEGTIDDK